VKEVASVALVGAAGGPKASFAQPGEAHDLTLLEAAREIHGGSLTSERYTQVLLERTRSLSSLNAFITVNDEVVLEAARDSDKARAAGRKKGLPGLPIGVKDSYITKDLPTSFGTAVASGYRSATDAHVVKAMREGGCLVFGKNNLVEMSYGLTGLNGHYGQARNPYNPLRITGGSSCGGAASVSARLVPASLGGDTVGSIRVPSSLCGTVGFKPTQGRWPSQGIAPISNTLDTAGAIARRVADCELLDALVTGDRARMDRVPPGLKGVRLAIAPRYFLDGADIEVEKIFNDTVHKLRDAGASVVEVDLGEDFGPLVEGANWSIFFHDTQPDITKFLRDNEIPVSFQQIYDGLEPHIKGRWARFVLPSGPGYLQDSVYQDALRRQRPEVQRRYADLVFSRADALIFPTTLCSAPLISEQWMYTVGGKTVNDVFLSRNTFPASLAGLPGISLPMGLTENGMPVGLELDGDNRKDKDLLHLARRVENVIGHVRAPTITL